VALDDEKWPLPGRRGPDGSGRGPRWIGTRRGEKTSPRSAGVQVGGAPGPQRTRWPPAPCRACVPARRDSGRQRAVAAAVAKSPRTDPGLTAMPSRSALAPPNRPRAGSPVPSEAVSRPRNRIRGTGNPRRIHRRSANTHLVPPAYQARPDRSCAAPGLRTRHSGCRRRTSVLFFSRPRHISPEIAWFSSFRGQHRGPRTNAPRPGEWSRRRGPRRAAFGLPPSPEARVPAEAHDISNAPASGRGLDTLDLTHWSKCICRRRVMDRHRANIVEASWEPARRRGAGTAATAPMPPSVSSCSAATCEDG